MRFKMILLFCALFTILTGCATAPEGESPRAETNRDKDSESSADGTIANSTDGLAPKPSVATAPEAEPRAMAEAISKTGKEAAKAASPGAGVSDSPSPPPPPFAMPSATLKPVPGQSGLKAGYSDDNEQFNLFLKFLAQYESIPHERLFVSERILIKASDAAGKPVANAAVVVRADGKIIAKGKTYADGSFALYPLEYAGAEAALSYEAEIEAQAGRVKIDIARNGPRSIPVRLGGSRSSPAALPVDIVFVLDTTGSMGEEIERLRDTIDIINANLTSLKPRPALRFGLVLYRDLEDDYVTEAHDLTSDLEAFRAILADVSADGGGDTPEELEVGLNDAVTKMAWNSTGLRLVFAITDAPAQLFRPRGFNYASTARRAASEAIKLFGIGTGGLPLEGEYLLRQVAQFTRAKYIFLTYGEGGESAGGKEGSVSHHTGTNFTTDKLEAVVIRFVKEEIALQSDKALESDDPYFSAKKATDESREETLGKLFSEALENLSDYSGIRLPEGARLAVLPIGLAEGASALGNQAEYFGAQLTLSAAKAKSFALVERRDLQALLAELELQLSGLSDESNAAKVGKFLGAEYLVTGRLYARSDRYELFLNLVRVETAEILAATKARIALELGL